MDAAVKAAHDAWPAWRSTALSLRAQLMRQAAETLRVHAYELALLDSVNTGNPVGTVIAQWPKFWLCSYGARKVAEMLNDARVGAETCDYFAGLIPMFKGETIPLGDDSFHYTVREPLGWSPESSPTTILFCLPPKISSATRSGQHGHHQTTRAGAALHPAAS
jgi:betaine-aldehyde dehydrogenase